MFLQQIIKKKNLFLASLGLQKDFYCLSQKKFILKDLGNKNLILLTKLNSLNKNKKALVRSKFSRKNSVLSPRLTRNTAVVMYIINIRLTNTNTLLNVTDPKGNTLFSTTTGSIKLEGKQKTAQPSALLLLIKTLQKKAKVLGMLQIAIHFYNTKLYYETLAIQVLKQNFFILSIKSYNLQPHNGCRPKKLKRL